jgi:arylsulfatase A-like enzyme
LKLADNTLLIFSSDNGGVGGYKRAGVEAGKEITDNAPLRGGKGMLYEGGVRVPFIFRWPGHVAAGTTSGEPICSVDVFPTFTELAAASRPPGYPLDGVSITPVLFSKDGKTSLGRDAIYWHFPGYLGAKGDSWRTTPAGAVRSGDYKLIEFFEDGRLELYNVVKDVGQADNLAEKEPAKVKELHEKLIAWRQSIGAKMPTKNTEPPDNSADGKKKRKRNRQAADDE